MEAFAGSSGRPGGAGLLAGWATVCGGDGSEELGADLPNASACPWWSRVFRAGGPAGRECCACVRAAGAGREQGGRNAYTRASPPAGKRCGPGPPDRAGCFEPGDQGMVVPWRVSPASGLPPVRPPYERLDADSCKRPSPVNPSSLSWQPPLSASAAVSLQGLDRPSSTCPLLRGGLHAGAGRWGTDGCLRRALRRLLALSPTDGTLASPGCPRAMEIMPRRSGCRQCPQIPPNGFSWAMVAAGGLQAKR